MVNGVFLTFRHHKNSHNTTTDKNETNESKTDQGEQDFMFNYHAARLQFGLFLWI